MKKEATVNPFNISRDELLNLAATKLIEQLGDTEELWSQAEKLLRAKVEEHVARGMAQKIDAALSEEMKKILSETVQPVSIFGDREGQPTTIRAALAVRAAKFWETQVAREGKESPGWGNEPRYKVYMRALLDESFKAAVKENAETIVAEFKKAIIADGQKMVVENINRLIK